MTAATEIGTQCKCYEYIVVGHWAKNRLNRKCADNSWSLNNELGTGLEVGWSTVVNFHLTTKSVLAIHLSQLQQPGLAIANHQLTVRCYQIANSPKFCAVNGALGHTWPRLVPIHRAELRRTSTLIKSWPSKWGHQSPLQGSNAVLFKIIQPKVVKFHTCILV